MIVRLVVEFTGTARYRGRRAPPERLATEAYPPWYGSACPGLYPGEPNAAGRDTSAVEYRRICEFDHFAAKRE
jgi:hypothetical protein